MQGLTEELFQGCVCKVTKVCWRAWAGLIQCSCFSTGKHEYYFQSIWNCLKWLFTVVLISMGSDQMEKLKGTKPEKWNNSRERGGPVHTITRFTAAKKHLSHGSLGLNCPAKVVRETPMQTLKLESFLPRFCWLPVRPGVSPCPAHSVFPIAFAVRLHLASTGLCLLNSDVL